MSETFEDSAAVEAVEAQVEPEPAAEPEVAVEPEPEPEPAAEPEPEPARQPRKNSAQQPADSSIEPGTRVSVSALSRGGFSRRSASVEAVQRRLLELGHDVAWNDPRGRFGEHTEAGLEQFRASRGRRMASASTGELVSALFEGTGVEVVA